MNAKNILRLATLCTTLCLLQVDTVLAQSVYNGGSVSEGFAAAFKLIGFSTAGDLLSFITTLTQSLRDIVFVVGVFAIVVAGFYLLLGFGDEGAKDRAKRIIIYTLIGIIIIQLADAIVRFFFELPKGTIDTTLPCQIYEIMLLAVSYVALIGTIAIVVAGFYLLLGFGSESSKDTAQKIIIYTIVGILLIAFASAIVGFAFLLTGGEEQLVVCGNTTGTTVPGVSGDPIATVLDVLDFALSLLATLAVLAIIVAGLMLILGFGSEGSRDRAIRIILYTIVGLLVIFFARVIVGFFLGLAPNVNL